MRKILLAAIVLGVTIASAAPAGARCLGRCVDAWSFPPVAAYPVVPYYAPPVYPYGYAYSYPYPFAYSYFRPDGPYGYNGYRNWRDTWQDDGVKVHAYTWR